MKKYLLTFIAVVFATAMMAQDKNVFQGKFKNEELKISLNINFQEKNVKVPGQEIFGDVEGYMDSSQCTHVWVIVSSEVEGNTAVIEMVNNYGSEDFSALLTLDADGSLTYKHLKVSTVKVPVTRKWQKIPQKVTFRPAGH